MQTSTDINLGPLTKKLLSQARWLGQDAYPASQAYADECERLLEFLDHNQQLGRFWPRLVAQKTQRDETLQEIRVAYFFNGKRLPVVLWEPPGRSGSTGEFSIGGSSSEPIFVEVKSPGWESELSPGEIATGRAKEEKYREIECRAYAPWESIRFAIRKAYPKFASTGPNLLVIADDLFVSLEHGTLPTQAALFHPNNGYGGEKGYFVTSAYQNLGGVGIFWVKASDANIGYGFRLFKNPNALVETQLPEMPLNTEGA